MMNVELTVLTWNIRNARGIDGRTDIERIAELIGGVRPDIVALQEVDRWQKRSGNVDQVAFLSEALEMAAAYCPTLRFRVGLRGAPSALSCGDACAVLKTEEPNPCARYGHALFVRGEIMAADFTHFDSWKRREPRGFIEARARTTSGIQMRLFSTHLGLFERERHPQVEALRAAASEGASREAARDLAKKESTRAGLTLLMGDFNAPSYSRTMRRLKGVYQDTRDLMAAASSDQPTPLELARQKLRSRSWPSRFPLRRLDYVLVREQVEVTEHAVLRAGFRRASDHLPLLVKLRTPVAPPDVDAESIDLKHYGYSE